jgi:hypothetical protein
MNTPTPQSVKEYMSIIGKRGGKKTAKKLGKEHYRKIAQQRWKKVKHLEKVDKSS